MLGHNRAPVSDWQLARGNYNFDDDGGAAGALTIFDQTGDVMLQVIAWVKDTVTSLGAATIELGVAGDTAALIALTAKTNLVTGRLWHDSTPTTTIEAIDFDGARSFFLPNGPRDIILTIATADLTAGDIEFYCLWRPLSAGASVVAR
jgi:hypothetical protein